MEYVYATLLIEAVEKDMTEERLTRVLEAANVDVDSKRIQALLSSWEQIRVNRDSYDDEAEQTLSDDSVDHESPELEQGTADAAELEEGDTPELAGESTPELDEESDTPQIEGGTGDSESDDESDPEKDGKSLGKPGDKTSYGELRGLRIEAEDDEKRANRDDDTEEDEGEEDDNDN